MMIKCFQACILFSVLLGCKVATHKAYTYTEIQKEIEYGVFHGKILGTMRRVGGGKSVQANPYTLIIWLSLKDKFKDDGCLLSINSVNLVNDDTKEYVLVRDSLGSQFRTHSDGEIVSSFHIESVKLSHVDHTLTFNYFFSKECNVNNNSGEIKMPFKKIYKVVESNAWQLFSRQ